MLGLADQIVELLLFGLYAYSTLPGFIFSPSCNCCYGTIGCDYCEDNLAAGAYQLDFTGIVDDNCPGTETYDCSDLNASFILDFQSFDDPCSWTLTPFPFGTFCDSSVTIGISWTIGFTVSGTDVLFVEVGEDYLFTSGYQWSNQFSGEPWTHGDDCLTMDERDIPFLLQSGSGTVPACDASSGTCAVTALT